MSQEQEIDEERYAEWLMTKHPEAVPTKDMLIGRMEDGYLLDEFCEEMNK